jgi:hypothetical protein
MHLRQAMADFRGGTQVLEDARLDFQGVRAQLPRCEPAESSLDPDR